MAQELKRTGGAKPVVIGIIDDDELFHFTIKHNLDQFGGPKTLLQFKNGHMALEYLTKNKAQEQYDLAQKIRQKAPYNRL